MSKVVKSVGKMVGSVFGFKDNGANEMAAAMRESAARDVANQAENARMAAAQNATLEAQRLAQREAAEATQASSDTEPVDVTLGGSDEESRRRVRNPRDQFVPSGGGAGIRIT